MELRVSIASPRKVQKCANILTRRYPSFWTSMTGFVSWPSDVAGAPMVREWGTRRIGEMTNPH